MSSVSSEGCLVVCGRVMPGVRLLVLHVRGARDLSPSDGARLMLSKLHLDSQVAPPRFLASLGVGRLALNHFGQGSRRGLPDFNQGQPNNGMHPTRFSADVIGKIGCLSHCVRAGDAKRWAASSSEV